MSIQRKKKKCNGCGKDKFIWAHGLCGPCSSKGKPARALAQPKKPIKSKARKATGEKGLFLQLYEKCGGKSEISGKPLLPPSHPMFHWQFAHILPKGLYRRYRLNPENIVCCTKEEHTFSTEHEGQAKELPEWKQFFERKELLKQQYNAK